MNCRNQQLHLLPLNTNNQDLRQLAQNLLNLHFNRLIFNINMCLLQGLHNSIRRIRPTLRRHSIPNQKIHNLLILFILLPLHRLRSPHNFTTLYNFLSNTHKITRSKINLQIIHRSSLSTFQIMKNSIAQNSHIQTRPILTSSNFHSLFQINKNFIMLSTLLNPCSSIHHNKNKAPKFKYLSQLMNQNKIQKLLHYTLSS